MKMMDGRLCTICKRYSQRLVCQEAEGIISPDPSHMQSQEPMLQSTHQSRFSVICWPTAEMLTSDPTWGPEPRALASGSRTSHCVR